MSDAHCVQNADAALYCRPMISRTVEAELADIHRQIDGLHWRGRKAERQEIEDLRARLRSIERDQGWTGE